ncbi:MAG: dTDP-4-dehydrorhamnose reductase [Balneolaceae bacterium]
MRVLITGGGGQLGKEWEDFCVANNIEFKSSNSAELNIADPKQIEEVVHAFKPTVLINCAAYTKVDLAEDEKEKAFLINGEGAKNLAQICQNRNIKLIHYSTDYIFSGTDADRELFVDGFSEDHDPKPINVYGASKLVGELAIKNSGCDYLILRVSWLCGKHGHNFVKTMLKLAETKDELSIVNDQFGSPTFAANVVENTWALVQAKQTGVFNISSSGLCTWFDFATEIFVQKSISIKLHAVNSAAFPTKAKRPAFSKLSTKKMSKIEGSNIESWKSGLQKLLKQF